MFPRRWRASSSPTRTGRRCHLSFRKLSGECWTAAWRKTRAADSETRATYAWTWRQRCRRPQLPRRAKHVCRAESPVGSPGPIGAFRRAVAQFEVLRADINDALTPRPSPGACSSRLGGASPWLQSPSRTSLDTLCHPSPFHRAGASLIWARLTDLRFCCAANVVTASVARDVDGCRDCSNRLLGSNSASSQACVHSEEVSQSTSSSSTTRRTTPGIPRRR